MAVESGIVLEGLEDLVAHSKASYLIHTPLRAFMKKAGAALRQAAARQSPKGRTNLYSRSWVEVYSTDDPPSSVTVKNTDPKHPIIALGSRAHEIRPLNKRALFWPGAAHPVAGAVHHPGTAASLKLRAAGYIVGGEIFGPIKDAFDAEVERRFNAKGGA